MNADYVAVLAIAALALALCVGLAMESHVSSLKERIAKLERDR